MSVATIEGRMGSGMTLTVVFLAYRAFKEGREVVSNFKLNFPYTKLDPANPFYTGSTIIVDDASIHLVATPNLLTALIMARRHGNTFLLTCHQVDQLDLRVRRLVETRIKVNQYPRDTFNVLALNLQDGSRHKFSFDGKPYYPLYDTFQIIPPPPRLPVVTGTGYWRESVIDMIREIE